MSDAGDRRPAVPDDGAPDSGRSDPGAPGVEPPDPVSVFPAADLDLRSGADDCYKCSTCDTSCPVAEVDDSFPGPKFQGPEQWRLKRKDDRDVDPSITDCSNCMRCEDACPADVPLGQMHNEARAEYVREQRSRLSVAYWRDRALSNYRTGARLASRFPRVTNFVMGNRLVRALGERLFGITAEREFPDFAHETFREWWAARGGEAESARRARARREERGDAGREASGEGSNDAGADKRVAYFHGCYANYNTPEVARALVRVYEQFGYRVAVPEQGCSGTPMLANGMLGDARRHADRNARSLGALIDDGYDVVASCTSCSMALRRELPELFEDAGVQRVGDHTYDALEYLRIEEDLTAKLDDATADAGTDAATDVSDLAYHAPCHARAQGLDRQARELFRDVPGVSVTDVGDSCSGISGTYGWKAEKYDTSMAIGEEMFDEMAAAPGETGLTECPTCAMQMEHGTGYEVRHPLEVLAAVLPED